MKSWGIINMLKPFSVKSTLRQKLLAIAVASFLVTGCSSDDDDNKSAANISGVAAKGIVTDGLVTAYLLDASGMKGAVVGTATTDADGNYSLETTSSYNGTSPLLLELTPSDSTKMVCDSYNGCGTVEHGATIDLAGTDFMLTSVIPGTGSDSKISAAITASTNMAASSILSSGDVTDSSILETTSKINQVVGVNILETTPVNVASESILSAASIDSQRYSIMLAALATQAFTETGSVDEMLVNLDNFNADFETDGDIGDEGGLSLTALYSSANSAAEAASDSLDSETLDEISILSDSVLGQLDDDGVFTPESTSAENPSEVAQAKAFVSEIREWANAIGDLESPVDALLDEADTITETLDSNAQSVLETYGLALSTAADAIGAARDADEVTPTSVDVMDDGEMIGTVEIIDNTTADMTEYALSTTGLTDSNIVFDTTLSLNESLDTDVIDSGDTTISFNGTVSDSQIQISIANASFTMGLSSDQPLGEDAELDGNAVTNMSLGGELTAQVL